MANYRLKLQVSLVTLLAVLASSAALAASASAVESLTGEDWLFNGEEVKSTLNVEIETELLLEDTKASGVKAAVRCSLIQVGSVGTNGEGEIKEILNLSKEAISLTPLSGTSLSCTNVENCSSAKVWAVDLPSPVDLGAGVISGKELLMLSTVPGASGNPGWYVECTILGIKVSDECTDEDFVAGVANVTGGVEESFSPAQEEELLVPLATCSLSKEATGVIEGKGVIKTTEAGTLSISAQPGPVVDANPNPVNFGTINSGQTREEEVIFTNLGMGMWTPGPAKVDVGFATFLIVAGSNTCNMAIAVNGTCLILLQFAPLAAASSYLGIFAFGDKWIWMEGLTN
jgi:hypothetical protein